MNYYTSDLHFSHENIIGLCNRPFKDIKEMNDTLIQNINQRTKRGDLLFILGDISCYGKTEEAVRCLEKIKTGKILIKGNHDMALLKESAFRRCFIDIVSNETITDGDYRIFLTHYPMVEWDGYYKGNWQFYGHIHNNRASTAAVIMDLMPTAVNVGTDAWKFMPKTAEELILDRKATYCLPTCTMEEFMKKTVFVMPEDRGTRILRYDGYKNI